MGNKNTVNGNKEIELGGWVIIKYKLIIKYIILLIKI